MVPQHIADPSRGAAESEINAGMERDGLGFRVCMHPDRTIRVCEEGLVIECDYCPAARTVDPGLRTELPTWLWRTT
ncbi:hypothetical protein [Streptomyces sp. S1D4-14]|uniref:hypothetical protein n=1 Tax=Streptomyces sp. S1D4-14 TaxID=2594461 RepID=UPI001164B889|nr:hypothetical protein [Streptomyces sp. S1D4-14]QDN64413.1 hypothetical protein FNV66_00850 [Streptomyces sp. S1D4-14]